MQLLDEGHTATCIQDCKYAWVAGGGSIAVLDLDARRPVRDSGGRADVQVQGAASKVEAGDLFEPAISTSRAGSRVEREFGWSTHDVQVDEAGYAWVVGGDGTIGFDTRPGHYGEDNLLTPTVVGRTGPMRSTTTS